MRRGSMWRLLILALAFCASARLAAAGPQEGQRLALVIGNAAYPPASLPTAADDAGLVAQSLAQIGFNVTAMGDADAMTLRKTLKAFLDKVRSGDGRALVFVYLSGYGVQYAGANFLVPANATIDRQTDVAGTAMPLAEIQQAIEALPAQARFFVYDLARDNQVAKADTVSKDVPLARGLTLMRAPRGSLYALNAAPGTTAQMDVPPYGVYARALAEMLRTPGLSAQALFARIRLRVAEVTGGTVVPWEDSNLDEDIALLPSDASILTRPDDRPIAGTPPDLAYWTAIEQDRLGAYQAFVRAFPGNWLAPRVKAMVAARLEASTWSESVHVDSPAAYWTYMQRYPRGSHYVDVRRRLAAIHAALEPPSRFDPYDFADLPPSHELASDDLDGTPSPHVPGELLPPSPAAIYPELAPPPLVPRGILPIPTPTPVKAWPGSYGRIDQPFVAGIGAVAIETNLLTDGTVMTLLTDDGPITRTVTMNDKGDSTSLQTDAADETISRTTTRRGDGMTMTTTQTGSSGGILAKIVTRIDALGERSTILTNGANQLVADVQTNRWGVVTDVMRGSASLVDPTFMLFSSDDGRDKPQTRKPESARVPPAPPADVDLPNPIVAPPLPPMTPPAATQPAVLLPAVPIPPMAPYAAKTPIPEPMRRPVPSGDSSESVPLPVPRPAFPVPTPWQGAGHRPPRDRNQ